MFRSPNPNFSASSFREQSAGKGIVFVYPWSNMESVFLKQSYAEPSTGILYYRISQGTKGIREWMPDLVTQFHTVFKDFGSQITEALAKNDLQSLARAFAEALKTFHSQPILYIDALSDPDVNEFSQFVNALTQGQLGNAQLVLSSRWLVYSLMRELVAQNRAVILRPVQQKYELLFSREANAKPQLEVFGFGKGLALLEGRAVTNWDGMLPRSLFFYLIDHPLITRDEIFAHFWPHTDAKDATDIFHVTKHKISEIFSRYLDTGSDYEITEYKQGFYIPSDNLVVHYDVQQFEQSVKQASASLDENEREVLLQRALDLYQGPYLADLSVIWAVQRREALALLHSEAMIGMARIRDARGDLSGTEDLYTRILVNLPYREDIQRALIRVYLRQGHVDKAREQYRVLEDYLYRHQGIKPSLESLELLREIESAGQ